MATSVAAIIRRFAAQASLTAVRSASVDTALKTVYVLELGSGHCKFGYHLARALLLSPSPDVRIKVLLSDFDEATLRATAALPCFK